MQEGFMITTVSTNGQTVVPVEIRRRLGLVAQSRLRWTIDGDTVRITRVPDDPVEALWEVFKQADDELPLTQDLTLDHEQELVDDERSSHLQ